jgi:hypothetical protein
MNHAEDTLAIEDIVYSLVPAQEWNGSVRLASANAEAVLEFIEGEFDLATRTLRLIIHSIVDVNGARVDPRYVDQCVELLRYKDAKVVQRLKYAVFELNELLIDRTTLKNDYSKVVTATLLTA